jgi:hypothetical protein
MSKDKRTAVEVKNEDGETVKIYVQRPTSKILSEAQRVSAKVWTDCVRDKIMTKQELKNFMYENNIWSQSKDLEQLNISKEIQKLEKQLYVGNGSSKRMKMSEAKEIAIRMRIQRAKLRDLIAEKMSLEQNTAEAISENAKFDYIVARCTFYENGQRVYSNLEDYNDKSDEAIAFEAATAMAQLLYSLDRDFEAKLPENRFLVNKGLVNDDLALVNRDGVTVDTEGRRINELGHYINDEGQRTDIEGNLLDEDGNYLPSLEYVEEDEDSSEEEVTKVETKPKRKTSNRRRVVKKKVESEN